MIDDLKSVPVSAFEAIDESSLMVSANSAQAGTAPGAAAAPAAAAGDSAAIVTWTPPSNGGQPILSYTVTGSPSGQVVVGGGSTFAVVYGLTNGVSYTFTVSATNVIGTGPPSPASNAVVPKARIVFQSGPVASPSSRAISQSTPRASPPPPR